jgi:hypothetical protein
MRKCLDYFLIKTDQNGFPIKNFEDSILIGECEVEFELNFKSISFIRIATGETNELKEEWEKNGKSIPLIGTIDNCALDDLFKSGESFRIKTYNEETKTVQHYLLLYSSEESIWKYYSFGD